MAHDKIRDGILSALSKEGHSVVRGGDTEVHVDGGHGYGVDGERYPATSSFRQSVLVPPFRLDHDKVGYFNNLGDTPPSEGQVLPPGFPETNVPLVQYSRAYESVPDASKWTLVGQPYKFNQLYSLNGPPINVDNPFTAGYPSVTPTPIWSNGSNQHCIVDFRQGSGIQVVGDQVQVVFLNNLEVAVIDDPQYHWSSQIATQMSGTEDSTTDVTTPSFILNEIPGNPLTRDIHHTLIIGADVISTQVTRNVYLQATNALQKTWDTAVEDTCGDGTPLVSEQNGGTISAMERGVDLQDQKRKAYIFQRERHSVYTISLGAEGTVEANLVRFGIRSVGEHHDAPTLRSGNVWTTATEDGKTVYKLQDGVILPWSQMDILLKSNINPGFLTFMKNGTEGDYTTAIYSFLSQQQISPMNVRIKATVQNCMMPLSQFVYYTNSAPPTASTIETASFVSNYGMMLRQGQILSGFTGDNVGNVIKPGSQGTLVSNLVSTLFASYAPGGSSFIVNDSDDPALADPWFGTPPPPSSVNKSDLGTQLLDTIKTSETDAHVQDMQYDVPPELDFSMNTQIPTKAQREEYERRMRVHKERANSTGKPFPDDRFNYDAREHIQFLHKLRNSHRHWNGAKFGHHYKFLPGKGTDADAAEYM